MPNSQDAHQKLKEELDSATIPSTVCSFSSFAETLVGQEVHEVGKELADLDVLEVDVKSVCRGREQTRQDTRKTKWKRKST